MLTSKIIHISETNAEIGIVALSQSGIDLGAHFMRIPPKSKLGDSIPMDKELSYKDLAIRKTQPLNEDGSRKEGKDGEPLEFSWWTLRVGA